MTTRSRWRWRLPAFGVAIVHLVASWGIPAAAQEAEATAPIADVELGLARGSVFEVPSPPIAAVNTTDPGDLPPVERAYDTAPPRVPHTVADFMPITPGDNWCVDCHQTDWKDPEAEPTAIPFSHYMDLRGGTGEIGDEIVGARWVCVSCHVPVTDAPPLVGNRFAPGEPPE